MMTVKWASLGLALQTERKLRPKLRCYAQTPRWCVQSRR